VVVTAQDGGIMGTTNATVFVSYAVNVQPVFSANCIGCHPPERGLNLTSYANLMAGATSGSGAVVIPGDGINSILYRRLTGDIQPRMPFGQPAEP
jgi:hypothetical protein